MERWRGRVALVTGASSGIGYCVTKALVERGMKVVACARNIAAIEKLGEELGGQPGSVTAVKCDVSKQEEVEAMFQRIREDSSLGRLDVCINNAGLYHVQSLLKGDPTLWKHTFEVNVFGTMMVVKEAIKLMQDSNVDDGIVVVMNSTMGKEVSTLTGAHCYTASKFAVTAITQGLRFELREMKSTIRITQISPGLAKTDFVKRGTGDEKTSEQFYSIRKHMQQENVRDGILTLLDTPPHVEIRDLEICALGDDLLK